MLVEHTRWLVWWQSRWQDVSATASERLTDCLLALAACDKTFYFYPYIRALLQISASLPVSTATPERTFSATKILKTYSIQVLGWQMKTCKECRRRTFKKTFRLTLSKSSAILVLKNRRLKTCKDLSFYHFIIHYYCSFCPRCVLSSF